MSKVKQLSPLTNFVLGVVITIIFDWVFQRQMLPIEQQIFGVAVISGILSASVGLCALLLVKHFAPARLFGIFCLFCGCMVGWAIRDVFIGTALSFTLVDFVINMILTALGYQHFARKIKSENNPS